MTKRIENYAGMIGKPRIGTSYIYGLVKVTFTPGCNKPYYSIHLAKCMYYYNII